MILNRKLYCNTLGCKMAYAVKGIMRMLANQFEEENVELTLEQYFLLNILENENGLILQELADIVDRDKSAVFRHIEELEEHYFVVRATDSDDKRRKLLLVTKPGINELNKARALDKKVNEKVTRSIPESEIEEIEGFITEFLRNAYA